MPKEEQKMMQIDNISKSFGALQALDGVSLSAKPGELIVLLGPNGAGKTTLIRLICGYLFPDGGNIVIDGKSPDENLPAYLRQIGYMPENVPLYGDMKVAEYLEFVAKMYGMALAETRSRISSIARELEIEAVLLQKIATLSKGYKKRVGLAAAILHNPQILVLDEPTEGLDPNQKKIVRRLLQEYAADKIVLVSTHVLEEAEAIASRVWIISQGKVAGDMTVGQLKAMAKDGSLASAFYDITHIIQGQS